MTNNTDILVDLIPKQEMINCKWRTFEHYPRQGADIVLHIKGYHIRENKYCHDFIRIPNFNGIAFNPNEYVPKRQSVVWKFSWLPISSLIVQHDRLEESATGRLKG